MLNESFSGNLQLAKQYGLAVLPGIFTSADIETARSLVLDNLQLMPNTRSIPSSRHLAGFHRYPVFEPLHLMLTGNSMVRESMLELCGHGYRTIGLSDITVNRSQQWHKDLLRGSFRKYLESDNVCASSHGKLFKVIAYLQDSSSLRYVPGSHKVDIPLDNDEYAVPYDRDAVETVSVLAGDAVIIDICTTHRGSQDSAFSSDEAAANPRILISTVFGVGESAFTDLMELGNAARLGDWMKRNLSPE
jgi:hypothetical protein